MKSSVVFCVLLGAILSVRAASVPPSVEAITVTTPVTNTITGLYNDTTPDTTPSTTPSTTPYTILDITSYTTTDTTPYTTPDTPYTILDITSYTTTDTTPYTTPDTPYTTPDTTPYTILDITSYTTTDTPYTTPDTTPYTILDITSYTTTDTPYTTPDTPYTTPDTTPYTTPDTTPYTTPDTTPYIILDTPYTTPDTTPYTTPDTTPYTTPDTPYTPVTSIPCCVTSPSTPSTTPSLSQIMCPDGWEVFQGRCYYFVNEGMTWPQAQSNCAMLESMLVSVHSTQEYGFLQQFTSINRNQDAWLGGFYLQDQWLWIDGSWFYNNTLNNEFPDSSNPCIMLNTYEGWSNSPCNVGGYSSICEKKSNVPYAMVCPEGWTGFQGRCYFYNQDSLTWPEANSYCADLQASLVSVHSPQEYFFLYQQTTANGFSPTWLGGFYLEDQWMWIDSSWFYQGFFTAMSQDSTNPCLSTYSTDGWSNYECGQSFPSFCVKNEAV